MLAKTIYLTDDDEDDRYFFASALEEVCQECSLTTSANGEELLRQLQNTSNPKPEIIFLDINMPKKNGFELLEEIRNNKEFADIPVIMFSTSNDHHHVDAAKKMGANLYLVKPNNFNVLKKCLLDIITSEGMILKQNASRFLIL